MRRIVWLASYPRSGNTWFRAFITNLLREGDAPVPIDQLIGSGAAERAAFDAAVGYDSGELTADEVERLRPEVYLQRAREAQELIFIKAHDACTRTSAGQLLFPPEATHSVLYFVRNPLDVCVSLAELAGHGDYDRARREMADLAAASQDDEATEANQLRQKFLSWSAHVTSWADATNLRIHVVRFEDMKLRSEETFGAATSFLGLSADSARIKRAIAFSAFSELREMEKQNGFREKIPEAKSFFRQGQVGAWRAALSVEQATGIVADHATVMRRFGYLDERGAPVF